MKLELAVMAGAESKQWLADLTKQLDRMEALLSKSERASISGDYVLNPTVTADDDEDAEIAAVGALPADEDEDEDFAPKKPTATRRAPVKAFDEDEDETEETVEEDESDEDEDDTVELATPTKAAAKTAKAANKGAKPKKFTLDDVNDACKARATAAGGKKGRTEVLGILKKKFKTETVSSLKPEQYEACIQAMAVSQ